MTSLTNWLRSSKGKIMMLTHRFPLSSVQKIALYVASQFVRGSDKTQILVLGVFCENKRTASVKAQKILSISKY